MYSVLNLSVSRDTDTAVNTGGDAAEAESAPPVEEEPRELTLDEYKALKGNRQKPTYNLRKAGEGEDLTQWKKMYALKKKEGEEEEEEEEV
jgi:plasminogen activator inhibitor 1 RNA-binding protein